MIHVNKKYQMKNIRTKQKQKQNVYYEKKIAV